MKRVSPLGVLVGGGCAAALAATLTATAPRPAAALPLPTVRGAVTATALGQALSGFDVYRSNCDGCHELYDPEEPKRTRQQWDVILTRMVKQRGATLTAQQYTAVLNYLDSFNRPKREIKWVEAPAKTRKAELKPADAGKLPAEWVDLVIGADTDVPWAVQADSATKSLYLQPLKTVADRQYPVLIDNTGLVRDGTAAARLQINGGKGTLGAGIVFGFRNPQSYFGVRMGPRDVVLYEVQGGQPAGLARAPMTLELKKWHTLVVDITGKQVTVTVDGKPVPALTRTVAAYQGGRMGLQTQGDTVALFDQWQMTVR
jgi:cytochrome c5